MVNELKIEASYVKQKIEVEKKSISEIARETGVSRRTISKIIEKNHIKFESSWGKIYPKEMTKLQEEILRGTILGDDCIYIFPTCKNPKLIITHAISQEEYVKLKFKIWKKFTAFKNPHKVKRESGYRFYFSCGANKCFKKIYDEVYIKNGLKKIEKRYLETLSPISHAFWFMDDGSRCKNRGLAIHTNCFSFEEVEMVCEWFKDKYNFVCWPQKRTENQWVIFFSNKTSIDYAELILPYVIPSMRYKLEGVYLKNPQRLHVVPFELKQTEDIV